MAQLAKEHQESHPADELLEVPNRGRSVATIRSNPLRRGAGGIVELGQCRVTRARIRSGQRSAGVGGTQCGQSRVEWGKKELALAGAEHSRGDKVLHGVLQIGDLPLRSNCELGYVAVKHTARVRVDSRNIP